MKLTIAHVSQEQFKQIVSEGSAPAAACDHPFRVTGEMCANCGEWDTDLAAIRARLRDMDAQIVAANERAITDAGRIRELEAELKLAQEKIADLRELNERTIKLAAEEASRKLAEVETQLTAQAEDHTPLSAIETLFTAGMNQCLIDEEYSSHTECPYPPDSISRHWWTRGYAHQARAFRAVELEARLKDAERMYGLVASERTTQLISELKAEAARLRGALEMFADETNWLQVNNEELTDWVWMPDEGHPIKLAQAALSEQEAKEGDGE